MTYTLAIDPGTKKSAWVVIDELLRPVAWAWEENERVASRMYGGDRDPYYWAMVGLSMAWKDVPVDLVIEDVTNMGMAVGKDVFETVRWSGRFDYRQTARFISRPEVKLHICGSPRAKDPNVKQAIIDRYGGQEVAIGGVKCPKCKGKGWYGAGRPACVACADPYSAPRKATGWQTPPGILYEFSKAGMGTHGWSALGVALTAVGGVTNE